MSAAEDLELITEVLDRLFFKVIEVAEKRASLEAIRKLEMAGRVTIGADGRYEPKNQQEIHMPNDNDNDKPFWWPLVKAAGVNADQWEPVRVGDTTAPEELSLLYQGWTGTRRCHTTVGREYTKHDPPRIRRKKLRLITWRLCVRLDRWHSSNEEMNKQIGDQPPDRFNRARLKWIESDRIEAPWCALEAQTKPFETVKKLSVGEEP